MKKSLVITLALVFVLGIAGTAFANPYSDVPAGHWAYKAVVDLQKAGVMEGAAGKFQGNQTLTRYEIAAITARAMAKADKADAAQKATIDKLAVEFSKELNDLGVRVAKLEKGQSNIKWAGDTRIRFLDQDKVDADATYSDSDFGQRVRLFFTANVNDDVTFVGKYQYADTTAFGKTDSAVLYEANLTHKGLLGEGSAVTVGRMSQRVGVMGYFLDSTGKYDGAQVVVPFGDVTVTGVFADMGKQDSKADTWKHVINAGKDGILGNADDFDEVVPVVNQKTDDNVAIAKVDIKASKDLALNGWYFDRVDADYKVYGGGFNYALAQDWRVLGDYFKIDNAGAKTDNYQARLQYKGVNAAVAGSWGAFVEYVDFEGKALDSGSNAGITNNEKGITVAYQTALMKNLTLDVFYSPEIKTSTTGAEKTTEGKYTRAQLNYMF